LQAAGAQGGAIVGAAPVAAAQLVLAHDNQDLARANFHVSVINTMATLLVLAVLVALLLLAVANDQHAAKRSSSH
jgi:uncharacterized membrane protein YadS